MSRGKGKRCSREGQARRSSTPVGVDDQRIAVARLRLFGPAREAAGLSSVTLPGGSVSAVIAAAEEQFGEQFSRVVGVSSIWLNGEAAGPEAPVGDLDEVAVIPPVSGG
jgi:molybdopterin converting factor small subunit